MEISDSDAHVLITGETGTGKELVANAIQTTSKRKDQNFVKINWLIRVMREAEQRQLIDSKSFIVFIDDGSTDKTWETVLSLRKKHPERIKALKLSRNFGHQNALLAGMSSFNFDVCITMDADLQDSPAVIHDMLNKFYQGYDIVYGVRSKREHDSFFKRYTASVFYNLMKILGVEIIRNHADFRLLSAEVVNTLKGFREK